MTGTQAVDHCFKDAHPIHFPPGRIKIANALKLLMEKKDFNAITISEIAKTAGVTDALIYKYFKDKRDLLHEVLREYLVVFVSQMKKETGKIRGARKKLRKLIHIHFNLYSTNRVFAKILLLEVRNFPAYFESSTYKLIKEYSNIVLDIIEQGVRKGEIRDDVSPRCIRQFILGGIEHFVLPKIIFDLQISEDAFTEDLCKLVFSGIESNEATSKDE